MRVVLLGTGNPLPDPDRAGPATLVETGGTRILVDAGRGVCMRLAAAGVWPPMLTAVLLTHLHSDHVCDLNDVVTTRWVMSPAPNPLPVVGPPGTAAVVAGMEAMLAPDVGWRRAHHADLHWDPPTEVSELIDGPVPPARLGLDDPGPVRVTAAPTDHRPVAPTVGYRIDGPDGSVVLAGDTVPCAGLDRLVAGADCYVQSVLRDDLVRRVPSARFHDTIDYHSTVAQAAETARRGGVGTLVLTHLVPGTPPGAAGEWAGLASGFDGEVVVAEDLTVVEIGGA